MADKIRFSDKVVDAALTLAEASEWEAVRLHDVADTVAISLDDIRVHFREKEDIVDAWFDRADAAMLRQSRDNGLMQLSARERLHRLIMVWLGSLAPHRRVTRQMILGKLEPGHIHYQIAGITRISRTVQWLREAAGRKAVLPWRAIEESALTAIYLATFFYWMFDDSAESRATSGFLDRRLTEAQTVSRCRDKCLCRTGGHLYTRDKITMPPGTGRRGKASA